MADFFTHFSCVLDVGTPDNAARALELYQAFMEENAREDVPPDGFLLLIQPEHGGTMDPRRGDRRSPAGDRFRPALRAGVRPDRPLGFPMGQHLLAAARQRLRRRRACARSGDPRDRLLDRHERLAGPLARTTSWEARPAMSIPDHAPANFQTLLRAAADGNLALMECIHAVTGEPRYVICAVGRDGRDFLFTPFGHLADGNPFDAYLPPSEPPAAPSAS
jgi:Family of unknown function (DUF6117)